MSASIYMKIYFQNEIKEQINKANCISLNCGTLFKNSDSLIEKYNLNDYKSENYTNLDKRFDLQISKLYEIVGSSREEALAKCKDNIYDDGSLGRIEFNSAIKNLNSFFDEIERENKIVNILFERKEY